jgi:hypothetical protein
MRKPVQLLATKADGEDVLVVLCDDGTIWIWINRVWRKWDDVPQGA